MPLDIATVKTALRQWIIQSTGLASNRVINNGQNAPEPPELIIILTPILDADQEYDRFVIAPGVEEEADGLVHIKERWTARARIDGFGTGAITAISQCISGLAKPSIYEGVFKSDGLQMAVTRDGRMKTPEAGRKGGQFEEHAHQMLIWKVGDEFTDDPGWADTLELETEGDLDFTAEITAE